jgi:iron complex transport system ATP-binding protein
MPKGLRARRISYLPQSRNVPSTTVGTLALHGRFPYLGYPRAYRREDREIAENAMAAVGVLGLREKPLAEISGGERQKAYLAMVLAQNADAVFLDEPTAHLDISCQLEVMALARGLAARGKTVVAVLHDLGFALRYSDRVAVFRAGRLLRAGAPGAIIASGALEEAFGLKMPIGAYFEQFTDIWKPGSEVKPPIESSIGATFEPKPESEP